MELFIKKLSDTDTKKRFAVPTHALPHFNLPQGAHSIDLTVRDSDGHLWIFNCSTRAIERPKPVFQAGWLQFVKTKDLKIGDVVVFYRQNGDDPGAEYRIQVKRFRIRLFSKDIYQIVA